MSDPTNAAQLDDLAHARLLSPVELAVLTRSWILHDVGATPAKLRDSATLLAPQLGPSALTDRTTEAADRLAHAGLLSLTGNGNRRRAACTPAGREMLTRIGVVDRSPLPKWTEVRDIDLTAVALGLRPPATPDMRKRFRTSAGLRGSVLATHHDLELPGFPTATVAVNALAWRELCAALEIDQAPWQNESFGTGAGLACVIGHRFGLRRKVPPGKLAALAAAACVQASGSDARALRAAIWQRWSRDEATARPRPDGAAVERGPSTPANDRSLSAWLREHGTSLSPYVAGSDKVFVAELWRVLKSTRPDWFPSIDALKQELLSLARKRELELSRADLVEGMDPDLVRRSEIRDLHATFHFVRLP